MRQKCSLRLSANRGGEVQLLPSRKLRLRDRKLRDARCGSMSKIPPGPAPTDVTGTVEAPQEGQESTSVLKAEHRVSVKFVSG